MLKLSNLSFEGYMGFDIGGARTEISCVKVNEVIRSMSMEIVEGVRSFEKI